ncbi:MAG: cell division protein ZipA C-terminal FtsZ-binding domain-containing protein [Gammaproteobacteria bacterium]
MPELRWTLLILGALFVGGLALWEWRRQRYARGSHNALAPAAGAGGREGERISPTFGGDAEVSFESPAAHMPARGTFREPTLTFPEVAVQVPNDSRDRFVDPPVVELDDEDLDRLKVEDEAAVDEFSTPASEEFAEASENETSPPVEPMIPKLSAAVAAPTLAPPGARVFDAHEEPTTRFDASVPAPASAMAAAPGSDALDEVGLEAAEPIVEWPEEDTRKIVALRLVSGTGERFQGRAVRLALAAEGFVLGKFEIFHKPGPDARAVLSAASLTKPGTFSFATIDAQRFGGLSLFAVLPGPLSPLATFDELMTTARALNDRLRGALQDERGEPLTPMRSANIRDSLTAAATAAAPVVGAAVPPPVVGSPGSTTHA